MLKFLSAQIKDKDILWLLGEIIVSFQGGLGKGLPLGNITSQTFANIYLHPLDLFIKNQLCFNRYLRYNDDFIILGGCRKILEEPLGRILNFTRRYLALEVPREKIVFRKLQWGIDFCGYIVLPNAILLRQKTKKRMLKNIAKCAEQRRQEIISCNDFRRVVGSYFGLLKHCDCYNIKEKIRNQFIHEIV